jgi:hypothetical protein
MLAYALCAAAPLAWVGRLDYHALRRYTYRLLVPGTMIMECLSAVPLLIPYLSWQFGSRYLLRYAYNGALCPDAPQEAQDDFNLLAKRMRQKYELDADNSFGSPNGVVVENCCTIRRASDEALSTVSGVSKIRPSQSG